MKEMLRKPKKLKENKENLMSYIKRERMLGWR